MPVKLHEVGLESMVVEEVNIRCASRNAAQSGATVFGILQEQDILVCFGFRGFVIVRL